MRVILPVNPSVNQEMSASRRDGARLPLPQRVTRVDEGAVALVHLTWSQRPESPPWPMTELLESPRHLDELIEYRY